MNKVIVLVILVFLLGCSKESHLAFDLNSSIDSNFVDIETAKKIASQYSLNMNLKNVQLMSSGKGKTTAKAKSIKKFTSIDPENSKPSFYIFNYDGDGFTIVAADDRVPPILAHSDYGTFEINDNAVYPQALVSWLRSTHEGISLIRVNNEKQTRLMEKSWNSLKSTENDPWAMNCDRLEEGETLLATTSTVGPLTQTKWHQGVGFNDLLPNSGCTSYSNGRAPVGCVATSVGQVIKYHQKPASLNWMGMDNYNGTVESQQLMVDLGSFLNMDYDCSGSGATNGSAVMTLNYLGYSSANLSNYDYIKVLSDLDKQRPVILSGGRQGKWWIFNTYADGHAWVCDGYQWRYLFKCEETNDPRPEPGDTGYKYIMQYGWVDLSMNWGWGGSYDGWYSSQNWNPSTHTFNYKQKMITDIY